MLPMANGARHGTELRSASWQWPEQPRRTSCRDGGVGMARFDVGNHRDWRAEAFVVPAEPDLDTPPPAELTKAYVDGTSVKLNSV